MGKRKAFYATLEPFKKKEVRHLQPYFLQGGKWHKLKTGGRKNGSIGFLSRVWKAVRRALA